MVELNQDSMIKHGVKDTMYINDTHKIIYAHIPKCASNTCFSIIARNINQSVVSIQTKYGPHSKNEAFKRLDYFKFTFIRNPWDRIVSCYYDRVIKKREYDKDKNPWDPNAFVRMGLHSKISFERFVEIIANQDDENSDYHWRSLHSFITFNDKIITDFIGKVENIEHDWNELCDKLNWKKRKINHENKSNKSIRKHSDYKSYYNSTTKKIIAKRFEKDIDIFKYTY